MLKGVTVGCGFFSRIQMESWERVEGAKMTAACDLDREKAEKFAADFGLTPYTDLDEMLDVEKPNFVDIATRPSTHVPLCRTVAAKGVPILCQKPIAETWEEACELASIPQKTGVRMMIFLLREECRLRHGGRRLL